MIMITRALLIGALLINLPHSRAQIGFSDWETDYFKMNSTGAQKAFVDKVEFPRFLPFPKIKPQKYGFDNIHCWNVYLKKCFAGFFTESKSYEFNKTASLAYGLLSLGNYETIIYHPQLKSNLNDTLWAEKVYNSLIPIFKESWKLLDSETRGIYSEIIKHTEHYLKSFNYQEELLFQQKLLKQAKPENFTEYSCNSSCKNEFRKAEAFVFRRINDAKSGHGNWTVSWMNKMIKSLKAQLLLK